jgi:hypothetical protein
MSIEDFKRELTNFKPTKDARPLRDIDMTRRSEEPESAGPQNPESDEDTSSSA